MKLMTQLLVVCSLSLLSIGLSGCGVPTGTINGTVLVDGQPMGGFDIIFASEEGKEYTALAIKDGVYRVLGGRGVSEIPAGTYRVSITPTGVVDNVPMPTVKLSRDYLDVATTPIVVEVKGGSNTINLEMTSM